MIDLLVAFIGAAAISALAGALAIRLARRWRLLDRPGSEAHKQHDHAVPNLGGAAMACGLLGALAVVPKSLISSADGSDLRAIVWGAALLTVLGLWDDRRPLRAWTKLLAQVVVVSGAVWASDLRIDSLSAWWEPAGSIAAVLWCLLLCNAYNLLDHADGLSASVALIACGVLTVSAIASNDPALALLTCAMAGCLAGFLLHNLPPARLYMGDAGSLPLGFLVGASTLLATFWDSGAPETAPAALLAPLLLTAIPLYDTAVVVVKRWRRHRPLLTGDRNHISHRLRRLGLSPRAALASVICLQMALAASALLLRNANWDTAGILACQALAILVATALLEADRDPGV